MKNYNQSQKPRFGTTLVGGLITILLTILLIPTSILAGLKIGILKDGSLEGLVSELNISGYTAELVPEIIHSELNSEGIDSEALLNCIPDGMMEDFADELISCSLSGKAMEPDFLQDYYTELSQNTSREVTSYLVDELVSQAGEDAYITMNQLAELDVIQDYSEAYETEITNVIATYGDGEGISVSDISGNKAVQNEISAQLEPVIYTTLSTALETGIQEFNEELTSDDDMAEYENYFEEGANYVTLATVFCAVLSVILIIVTFINYHRFINYAFRHNGTAFLISGLLITALGLAAKFGANQLTDTLSRELGDAGSMTNILENMLVYAMDAVFSPIRTVGYGFLIAAVVMLLLAKVITSARQSKSCDDYE